MGCDVIRFCAVGSVNKHTMDADATSREILVWAVCVYQISGLYDALLQTEGLEASDISHEAAITFSFFFFFWLH